MKNLAGDICSTEKVTLELKNSGAMLKKCEALGEVNSSVEGKLITKHGVIKLSRAWTYWVVSGIIPASIAMELEQSVHGKSIRPTGHCMPENVETYFEYMKNGKTAILEKEADRYKNEFSKLWKENEDKYCIVDSYKDCYAYVEMYHIDTQEALDYFVKTVTRI